MPQNTGFTIAANAVIHKPFLWSCVSIVTLLV